jgi:nitrite reductase (NADH) small subunit
MAFTKVGSLGSLPAGEMTEVTVGGKPYAICHVDGEVHALEGTCPHMAGPLGQGALHEHMVVCPWHAWEFDCRTGENDRSPDVKVANVPVRLDGDEILIDVP